MKRLWCFVYKELLLLGRDLHGLLLLFVMPAVFVLIMTFALQNQYADQGTTKIDYFLIDHDNTELSEEFVEGLDQIETLRRLSETGGEPVLRAATANDESKFLIVIIEGFEQKLLAGESAVRLEIAPGTKPVIEDLVSAQIQSLLGEQSLSMRLKPLLESLDSEATDMLISLNTHDLLTVASLYQGLPADKATRARPSSVQQNVPGWLLFSMFFIAIPLSNTLIGERQQGTLARLRTMGFPYYTVLLGKLIPYFLINLLQVVGMLAIGVYLVPLLGGERLNLGSSFGGLALVSVSASFAAVAYALFIAQLANTTEQATILSGVCNIIMAALGGVMVPRFIMPPLMQDLSAFSPMAWGLDGFLDILLRNGDITSVLGEAAALMSFGLGLLVLSIILFTRRSFR